MRRTVLVLFLGVVLSLSGGAVAKATPGSCSTQTYGNDAAQVYCSSGSGLFRVRLQCYSYSTGAYVNAYGNWQAVNTSNYVSYAACSVGYGRSGVAIQKQG